MREVNEKEMLEILSRSKNVSLLEPDYERKYPPLGLAKIATLIKSNGGKVQFGRSYSDRAGDEEHDLICMTTLFTYDSKECRKAILDVRGQTSAPLLIGGICASLAPRLLEQSAPMFMQGENLLFKGYSRVLDQCVPDYSIDWGIEEEWKDFSFAFTSRGCVNRCPYCAVWRLEPGEPGGSDIWVVPNWREHLVGSHVMVSDNNLSASPDHLEEVVKFLAASQQTTTLDNGLDCKFIGLETAKLLAQVCWAGNGLRLAFDRIEEDGIFQKAIRMLLDAGVGPRNIMAYVLFNHYDSPKEAEYRLLECVKLGIQPYPQRFTPLNWPDRRKIHVGKKWTKALGCCFGHYGIMGKFRVQGNKESVVSFKEFINTPQVQDRFGLGPEDLAAYEA